MLELLAVLVSLAKPPSLPAPVLPSVLKAASFQAGERAVDNWRAQAALDLDIGADTALRWLQGDSPPSLPRCIRLNNYWCIKKAGWAGELGADSEGHVAFASAEEGAMVAAQLLRRYYLDYGRRSARAIVTHWAPAQCGLSAEAARLQPLTPAARPQASPSVVTGLARYGIGNTLRARWLAAHGRGGTIATRRSAGKVAVRRFIGPNAVPITKPAAAIALAKGMPEPPLVIEPPLRTERLQVASASPPAATRQPPLVPVLPQSPQLAGSCASETFRLTSYAARAIQGIARSPDEDLKLFAADGSALPALPRLLANMANVEIGPYRADAKLIDAAVAAMRSATAGVGAEH